MSCIADVIFNMYLCNIIIAHNNYGHLRMCNTSTAEEPVWPGHLALTLT